MAYEYAALPDSTRMTPESYSQTLMQVVSGPSGFFAGFPASKVAFTVQDMIEKWTQDGALDKIFSLMPNMLNFGFDVMDECAKAGPTGSIAAVRAGIETQMNEIKIAMKAGLWAGAGSTYSGIEEDFFGASTLLQAYKNLAWNTAVTPRMRRYWNQAYRPNYPNMTMAFQMMCRGLVELTEVKEAGQYDGWSDEDIERLISVMYNQPTPHEAFFMWRKDKITADEYDLLVKVAGYSDYWSPAILENFWYVPTLYDLVRLADFIELDQTWALTKMKARGLKDEDAAKIWEMLEIRPLREETRTITGKGLYCRQHGYWTHDYFEGVLKELKLRSKEITLLNYAGDVAYEIELIEEWVDILRWRFRTAVISEEEFMQGLLDLGIIYEKANLIVELEKAKGYYGYY